MISIRRLSTGFEVKTRSVLPHSKPTKYHAGSLFGALMCVKHYFGDHFNGQWDNCPICIEGKKEKTP